MIRYLRLYLYFLRFSFSRAMEFRLDFFFRIVMDALFYATNLAFFAIIYEHTPWLAGWRLDQALVFISGVFLVDALLMTVFTNNMFMFPVIVNNGDLDYHLVRPVSPLFMVSVRDFAANSLMNVFLAAGIMAWALGQVQGVVSLWAVAQYLVLIVAAVLLSWMTYMLVVIPVFWLQQGEGLRQLYYGIDQFAERPHAIFPTWLQRVLMSVLPFALMGSVQAQALFDGESAAWRFILVGVGLGLALRFAWKRGLRAYGSASS